MNYIEICVILVLVPKIDGVFETATIYEKGRPLKSRYLSNVFQIKVKSCLLASTTFND